MSNSTTIPSENQKQNGRRLPPRNEQVQAQRAGVVRAAFRTAAGSAAGNGTMLTTSAFAAIPTIVTIVALVVFGLITLGALAIAAIYITRG